MQIYNLREELISSVAMKQSDLHMEIYICNNWSQNYPL